MKLGLEGKVALVAASSKGLGRAVAEELAAGGCKLALCARGAEALEGARREIVDAHGVEVIAKAVDLSSRAQICAFAGEVEAAFGRVDVLVTNAGGPPPGPFEAHGPEAWEAAWQLNMASVVELVRAVLPGMKERRFGRILNVTSIAVKQPVDGLILSNSVRAAVTGFARTLANEVAGFGVTVNNLLPGYTRTERLVELSRKNAAARGVAVEEVFAEWEAQIPMGRVGEPREFAALAAFLASDRASYITGTSIPVDGGWTRGLL